MNTKEQLIKKFENKTARVAVVGMGYVGLPLATVFADAGFEVTGIDPVSEKWMPSTAAKATSWMCPLPMWRNWSKPAN